MEIRIVLKEKTIERQIWDVIKSNAEYVEYEEV